MDVYFEEKVISLDEEALAVSKEYDEIVQDETLFYFWISRICPEEFGNFSTMRNAIGALNASIEEAEIIGKAILLTRKNELAKRVKETEQFFYSKLMSFLQALSEEESRQEKIKAQEEENEFLNGSISHNIVKSQKETEISAIAPGETRLEQDWKISDPEVIWKAIVNAMLLQNASDPISISRFTSIPIHIVAKVIDNAAFQFYKNSAMDAIPKIGIETERGIQTELRQQYASLKRIIFERQIAASSHEQISDAEIVACGLSTSIRDSDLRKQPGASTGYVWYKTVALRTMSDTQRGARTISSREYYYDEKLRSDMEKILSAMNKMNEIANNKQTETKVRTKKYNFDLNAIVAQNTPSPA